MIKSIQDTILPAMKRLWGALKPLGVAMARWLTDTGATPSSDLVKLWEELAVLEGNVFDDKTDSVKAQIAAKKDQIKTLENREGVKKSPLQKVAEGIGTGLQYLEYVFKEIGKAVGIDDTGDKGDPGTRPAGGSGTKQSWIQTLWNIKWFVLGLAAILAPGMVFAAIGLGVAALKLAVLNAPMLIAVAAGLAAMDIVTTFIEGWKGEDIVGADGRTGADKL